MPLQALNDNVLIEVFETEIKSPGGIIIPQIAQEKQDKAVVVSIGELVKDTKLKVGSIVHAVKGAATKNPVTENGKTYYIVKDYDLQAHIPPQEN